MEMEIPRTAACIDRSPRGTSKGCEEHVLNFPLKMGLAAAPQYTRTSPAAVFFFYWLDG